MPVTRPETVDGVTPTEMCASAARDTSATAEQLEAAAQTGAAAGQAYARTGHRPPCPYELGTLTAHVWVRWLIHERLSGVIAAGQRPA